MSGRHVDRSARDRRSRSPPHGAENRINRVNLTTVQLIYYSIPGRGFDSHPGPVGMEFVLWTKGFLTQCEDMQIRLIGIPKLTIACVFVCTVM